MYEKVKMQLTANQAATQLEATGRVHLTKVPADPFDPNVPVFLELPIGVTARRIP